MKKLKGLWEQAVHFSEGNGKIKDRERFSARLDKIANVLNCKCRISLCSEFGCEANCDKEVHIRCSCPAEKKIPLIKLRFVRAQRDKTGSLSTHMISSVDKVETRRQEAAIASCNGGKGKATYGATRGS